MAALGYGEWLARGRDHQAHGRAIDAMLCFRQAMRADPDASDARFHLGEVLWQLGQIPAAIAAWRDTAASNADHLAPRLALAEALLVTGDAAAAVDAADATLRIAPGNGRAAIVRAIAGILRGDGADSIPAIAGLLGSEPQLLAVPTIAGSLALALDRAADAPGRAELLAGLASSPASLANVPALLLALVVEQLPRTAIDPHAVAAVVTVSRDRQYDAGSHEALRRIALAMMGVDAAVGGALAARYALLCAEAFAVPVPLTWPRRSAGDRTRVVILVPPTRPGDATLAMVSALAALPREAFDIAAAMVAVAAVAADADAVGCAYADLLAVPLVPAQPGTPVAMSIAVQDPDVLLDFTGLTAAAGPVLAQRPARALWTAGLAALANVAPLVDHAFPDGGELAAALHALHARHDANEDCALDASALLRSWDEAVRTHQGGDKDAARAAHSRMLKLQPGYRAGALLARNRRARRWRQRVRACGFRGCARVGAAICRRARSRRPRCGGCT